MKGKIFARVSKLALFAFSVVALGSVSKGCTWYLHQPKEPESLRKMAE